MPGLISDLFNWFLIPIRGLLVKHIYNTPSSLGLLYHAGHCFIFFLDIIAGQDHRLFSLIEHFQAFMILCA